MSTTKTATSPTLDQQSKGNERIEIRTATDVSPADEGPISTLRVPAADMAQTRSAKQIALSNEGTQLKSFEANKSRQALLISAAVIAALACFGAYRWFAEAQSWVKTNNAYVAGHIHQVSSRVAGTLQQVLVEENQAVNAGTVIARLDKRDFEVKEQQAEAQLSLARAQWQQAKAQIAQAEAGIKREQAHVTKAKADLARAKTLAAGSQGAISKQELDNAQAAFDASTASLQVSQSAFTAAAAVSNAAEAQEAAAAANLREAELQIEYAEIKAPVSGKVGRKNLEVGNRVQPGQTLLALVQSDLWVIANLKETQLGHLKPGQPVLVEVDAFPERILHGQVESISPASGSQFALLPPENATGNFTKIVQRVPVKIILSRGELEHLNGKLAPGMSTVVRVKVRT
jgi:membrane fusion protein (multidrug efflux system)